MSFTEDVLKRYEAYGWHVQHVADGNTDVDAIAKAIEAAKAVTDKPSIIKITTRSVMAPRTKATPPVFTVLRWVRKKLNDPQATGMGLRPV